MIRPASNIRDEYRHDMHRYDEHRAPHWMRTAQRIGYATAVALIASTVVNIGTAHGQASMISGTVFVDANANGKRDANEPGAPNVVVSNQDQVVKTDAQGAFSIPSTSAGIVFISVPDGYRAVGAFWQHIDNTSTSLAFAIARAPVAATFSFVHASDTHISPASVERTRRMRTLVDSIHPTFAIITGDLVRDALRVSETEATGYYELFATEAGTMKTPFWTVPGNHENFGIERELSKVSTSNLLYGRAMYHHFRGPDYYSFTYGGVHFVGLNTVDIDDQSYYGHVDSVQLAWLARDIEQVPPSMPVVTFDHIPFYSTFVSVDGYEARPPAPSLVTVNGKTSYRHTVSNAADVLAILRKRQHVLALGGHVHAVERFDFETDGMHTRFVQAAAIVAPTDRGGLHFSSGITLYTVRNGKIDGGRFIPLQ